MLTRMRQLVLHPGLIPANYLEQLQSTTTEPPPTSDAEPPVVITTSDRLRLQSLLAQAIEDNEECPICFGILSDPRSTPCAHFYCLAWYVLMHQIYSAYANKAPVSLRLSHVIRDVPWYACYPIPSCCSRNIYHKPRIVA
jgi:hypothetical protein